ncbi:D-2-hydroxyisocaproate dehydrogenase [Lentilactobacillus parabuchneri]|jgi:D-lactate dehydrogenase|uniref:D-2-hydroxyisocaproate dehydrogenase n=6 Tax=Lentilactobacillus parabuchneri TaxID=152331 RepID=A0A1X1FCY7_9LACO|nr:D-2-hydroxyacid dehydrogenase [Lentilactobacillus parabuchneri]APR08140.1 D-2-hydroxyisocaproate dehydrogenase [Lentilactobacillus parabuchneri]KRM46655.1 D-lactate dehydrogenase [Lentilactobacillus parabuchneri DSM 5707 = NBRC 107865]KRN76440.1 D-lactate dehydrogenase [Lentilactobacillus parabuchneri]MBW0222397.1 D-2-hydroxyacid dehydrogenase [Lentilactobacillus parabuchneri]MBW0244582.1 D-2-hydroxyacid dehydrogenase [Lentilactobacillus parabuchneri]
MKFIVYNVRDDEIPFVQKWGKDHGVEVAYTTTTLNQETVEEANGFDGISCLQTIPYSQELFESMKSMGIKYLSLRNVGVDNIDLAAAKENDVQITNVPAYSPQSIAEFAVMMALYLSRKVGYMQKQLDQNHQFHFSPYFMGRLMSEQTVGIIGTGRIGQEAIKLFKGLGSNVIAYDKYPQKTTNGQFVYVNDIEELLTQSDIISIHMPATEDNYHQFNHEVFEKMKDTALLINTARGSIVKTDDLLFALQSGEIAGAGIDTIENESADLQDSRSTKQVTDPDVIKLSMMPNVLITPHSAFHTSEAVRNMIDISLSNLVSLNNGDKPKDLVD